MLLVALGQVLAASARRIGAGHLAPVMIPVALFLIATAPAVDVPFGIGFVFCVTGFFGRPEAWSSAD
ncbi:MAG TPA: hypothetical protein VG186_17610 [Solirubrobacteraceae bacterium]|jgi:hypothetical protein|nr:hypothetical protein [Solirubrobacteraceae bacterium]